MAATVFLFWPLVLGQVAFVEGDDAQCPAASEVERRVRGILGIKDGDALEEKATLLREGATLKIVVRRKDGSVLGEKVLSAAAPCEDLEGLASVVVATWISDLHPEFVATLPPAPSRGEMPGAETEGQQPTSAPPAPVSTPVTPPIATQTKVTREPLQQTQHWRFELGAAGGTAVSGAGAALLGSLGARWVPKRFGIGAALAAHAMTPTTEPLSMGSVRYWRWPLVVGPVLRVPLGAVRLDFHAGPALGWLHVEGRDFAPSQTRNVFRGGGLLGLRAAYGAGRWQGFLEGNCLAWGKTEAFIERGNEKPSVGLPSVELYATLGASWAL